MTREEAIALLDTEFVDQATNAGKIWGRDEFELWCDQHDDAHIPEWTLGTWSGHLPFGDNEDLHDAYESLLDLAARDEWTNCRNRLVETALNVWSFPESQTNE